MAESVGSLYLSLGLNLSELETGFVTASQTVAANINRLSRESQLIRIRSQVEIEGLDEVADAERIAQIRTTALNQQLTIQRDRVRILSAELQSVTAAHGANSAATQRATIRLERERLALAQLESELQNLTDTTQESAESFDDLSNLLPEIPTKLQAIGMAAGAMATGINFAVESTQEMIENFRELQQQSYELNMSFNDTKQFLREMKLAGGDIGDFEGYIRGITDAFVKGEYDDPEFIALRKYGAEITDATGRLKSFKDITEEVYQAWLKADAAGEGIEFLQLTGGEAGVRDAIQYFERLKEAREDAAKIQDANLNYDKLHELDRALNLTSEQADELKNALGNIFTPAVKAGVESFFNVLHDGTEFLVKNREEFQRWGLTVEELIKELAPRIENLFPSGQLQTVIKSFKEIYSDVSNTKLDLGTDKANAQLAKLQTDAEKFYSEGLTTKAYEKFFGDLSTTDFFKDNPIVKAIENAKSKQEEYNAAVVETTKSWADFRLEAEQADGSVLSQYGLQRIKEFKDELEDLRIELGFDDNDYEKAKAQLDLWKQRELTDKLQVSADERAAIEELYAAKSEQIEQERADKLAEIRESITSADKTALEQKLDSIEKEKQAWLKAGMEEAEAEQLAQQQKTNYIKGINEQLSAELNSLGQTDLQRKLSQIEQEKQAWIQKGADEEQAERLAQEKIRQAHEETDAKLNEIRQSVAALDNTEFENRLAAIEREKNAWIQAGMEKAEAEALAQQKITKAVNDYAKQRAEAEEQYIAQVQAAREEANRKNQQAIADATNILKSEAEEFAAYLKGGEFALEKLQRQKLIDSGVDPKLLEKMTTENYSAYKAAKERTNPLPNFEGPYSPKSVKMPDILMEVPPSFDKVSVSADNAAESLDNLARSAGYKPTEGVDGINDIKAYERPDGSTFITNNPQDLEDDIKNVTAALNDLPANVKDAVKEISNVEPTQIPEVEPTEIPEIDSSVITESMQSLSEMPEAVQAANESLNELPQAVLGVMEQISAIEPQQFTENNFSEIEQSLTQLPTVIQTVSESLNELPTAISGLKENLATEITQLFSPMTETLSEVTVRINDFATSLGDFLQKLISGGTTSEQRTPVEVTNNISIDEAHAWDYDHIQELAERVAAVLKPEILSAIGGDSNSY